jgi:hypothetical protein
MFYQEAPTRPLAKVQMAGASLQTINWVGLELQGSTGRAAAALIKQSPVY